MRTLDRQFFSGYYLSDDGVTIFGVQPYHSYQQGKIGERYLLFCLFSELQLNDDITGTVQESADMAPIYADDLLAIPETLTPYAQQVIAYDRYNGLTDEEIIEKRGFLLHPCFAGKTHAEVCLNHPVEHAEIADEDGNVSQSPSHWPNSQEGI